MTYKLEGMIWILNFDSVTTFQILLAKSLTASYLSICTQSVKNIVKK